MAPLLGRKPFPLAKPPSDPPAEGEEVFVIEHTKEAFKNREYPLLTATGSLTSSSPGRGVEGGHGRGAPITSVRPCPVIV